MIATDDLPLRPASRRALAVLLALLPVMLATGATGVVVAQEPPLVRPGDARLDPAAIAPFEAHYRQMGQPFWVQARRVEGERPVLGFLMSGGGAADAIGVYADTLGFAYRKFDFGAFGREHIDVSEQDGTITMLRMSLDPDGYRERREVSRTLAAPVFDGTVAYWLLASLPLEAGFSARAATLWWTEEGFEEHVGSFEVQHAETLHADDGRSWDCWVVLTRGSQAELRSWISREAPYLLKQTMTRDGATRTVIELDGLSTER